MSSALVFFAKQLLSLGVLAAAMPQELPPLSARGRPAIKHVAASPSKVPLYGKLELTIDLTASYDNPFDPAQIEVTAEFTSPSGKKETTPGFFYQGYRNRHEGDDSKSPALEAVGLPCWKVRLAPRETGAYTYTVRLHNPFSKPSADVVSPPGTVDVGPSSSAGFIRVSPVNHRYFQFDSGRSFFPIGQNLQNDWPVYRHSRLLVSHGANCVRAWTFCHWTWLEWTHRPDLKWAGPGHWMRSYDGAGKYNQRVAWVADDFLDRCGRDGLYAMLCMGNGTGGGELSAGEGYGSWDGHPYNAANGGFLDSPKKFWTDPRAKNLYQQRLRYIVARWGYSQNIWAWEFWNELGEATPEIVAWHREMASFLRRLDPNRHLITSSTWQSNPKSFAGVWDLNGIDFTQSHIYSSPEMPGRIGGHLRLWAKPHVVGEGGGPSPHADELSHPGEIADPEGVGFHDSLWEAFMLGAAGPTLPWYWRERIEPKNLFFHYQAVARFADGVPWGQCRFRPLETRSVQLLAKDQPRWAPALLVPLENTWGRPASQDRFKLGSNGELTDALAFPSVLYGSGRRAWRRPPTIEVDLPEQGRFLVRVNEVAHGILEIRLDGKTALREESFKGTRKAVGKLVSIDMPAGRHEITLDNAGSDWIRIGHCILTNARDAQKYPNVDVYGIQTDDQALIWIRNRLNQWAFREAGFTSTPIGPAALTIAGLRNGPCQVQWWDTRRGAVTTTITATVNRDAVELQVPVVDTDVACKLECHGSSQ